MATMERNARKIFIQRDYSLGTAVRFSTEFPRELIGKVRNAIHLYLCPLMYSYDVHSPHPSLSVCVLS